MLARFGSLVVTRCWIIGVTKWWIIGGNQMMDHWRLTTCWITGGTSCTHYSLLCFLLLFVVVYPCCLPDKDSICWKPSYIFCNFAIIIYWWVVSKFFSIPTDMRERKVTKKERKLFIKFQVYFQVEKKETATKASFCLSCLRLLKLFSGYSLFWNQFPPPPPISTGFRPGQLHPW